MDSKSMQPGETPGFSAKKIRYLISDLVFLDKGDKMAKKHVVVIKTSATNKERERYYRKNVDFFKLILKLKLWASRTGTLHSIKSIEIVDKTAKIETYCGKKFVIYNSKKSRAARWLRNKWCACACKDCQIPDWKLAKYTKTKMTQKWGSNL